MGPTLDDVARSLSRSMPVGGVCVTAERRRLPILVEEARRRDCRLVVVDPASVSDAEMRGFSWITFKENVAIALAVAGLAGVDRARALHGMWTAPPDPGVLSVSEHRAGGLRLRFANVFAANDPQSTMLNIRRLQSHDAIGRPLHLVINCRPDRMERNAQMGALVATVDPQVVFLIGHPTKSARTAISPEWSGRVVDLGGRRTGADMLAGILDANDGDVSIVAVGNIHGQGEVLLEELLTLERMPIQPTAVEAAAQAEARTAILPAIRVGGAQ